jgi:hypothetical protein
LFFTGNDVRWNPGPIYDELIRQNLCELGAHVALAAPLSIKNTLPDLFAVREPPAQYTQNRRNFCGLAGSIGTLRIKLPPLPALVDTFCQLIVGVRFVADCRT